VQVTDGCEAIKAFIVLKDEPVSVEDLLAHCRHYLASYKMPKHIEFRTELPQSILGKMLRRVLRVEEGRRPQLNGDTPHRLHGQILAGQNISGCKAGQ
jgi:long-chain acyl-CoA synthetase